MSAALTVVKLGGSLLAAPDRLRARLRRLASGADGPCLIVPGGGPFADAVRTAQGALGFDDGLAHRLALDAMGRMAEVFLNLEPGLAPFSPPLPPPYTGLRPDRPLLTQGSPSPFPNRACPTWAPENGSRASPRSVGGGSAARVWEPSSLRAGHPDIPETWDVTSDSLALWLAEHAHAAACILVKSVAPPHGTGPADWARLGLVDAAFPVFAARYAGTIRIEGPVQGRVAA